MNAAEQYLKEIRDVLFAQNGLLSTGTYLDTSINLLAAQNIADTAVRAASQSFELWNLQYRGVLIAWNITTAPGVQTVQLFVDALNPATAQYFAIAQGGALTTIGQRTYMVYPGAIDTNTELTAVTQLPLPRRWRIRITHSGTGDWVYSLGIQYLI